ncbi:DNA helicase [Tanacetum coccineum]|uniref:ATP-dependent DNA helicase n=1 Tax=Tanacetum coccineum TaxID=301880 RepID=A0ABQ5HEF7_9ASTR
MSDDIPRTTTTQLHIPDLYMNDPELEGSILYELQAILNSFSRSFTNFGLPPLSDRLLKQLRNKEMLEEKNYKRDELAAEMLTMLPKLNADQRKIYDLIVDGDAAKSKELYLGNIFLVVGVIRHCISTLAIRTYNAFQIQTSFGIDIGIHLWNKKTHAGQLLAETHLIIWDESPMNDRRCFEALDRTLRDIMDTPNQLFGGKSIVLGGEFRQTLSVKKGASKLEIVASSIAELELWHHFKVGTLTKNMRLIQPIKNQAEQNLSRVFANWLLNIVRAVAAALHAIGDLQRPSFKGGEMGWTLWIGLESSTTSVTPYSLPIIILIYIVVGVLIAGDNMLYSVGLLYLSASTYSLICATQLALNAVFSFFINSQKFTALIFNSVVVLSLSASLLAVNHDSVKPVDLQNGQYALEFCGYTRGFGCTPVAAIEAAKE